MADVNVVPNLRETYLNMIKRSIGTNMFRNSFAYINGKYFDVMSDGITSCAFYVSSILTICTLCEKTHATVLSTEKDLIKSGWYEIKEPEVGCVIIWDAVVFQDGQAHEHIGFYIGNGKAISNSSFERTPTMHDWEYRHKDNKERPNIRILYMNDALKEKTFEELQSEYKERLNKEKNNL